MENNFFEIKIMKEIKTAHLILNRPEKRNLMNLPFWLGLESAVRSLEDNSDVRVVIISGNGKSFSMGLDLEDMFNQYGDLIRAKNGDERAELLEFLKKMQAGFNAIADGKNIYIAAVHKHCVGGAVDLIAACDLRLCSKDAIFSVREAKVAIVADMGSLNRLPAIIGEGNTRMLALTGRDISAEEAHRIGLVNEIYENKNSLIEGAEKLAKEIVSNPVESVQGTKAILNYNLNHSQKDGLENVLLWNTAFIDTLDLQAVLKAFREKKKPHFKNSI